MLGRQGKYRVDVLRKAHDTRHARCERWTSRRIVADLGGVGEPVLLELRGDVGVEVEAAADMEVTLRGRKLVDSHVEGPRWVGQAPCNNQRTIDPAIQSSVGRPRSS